MVCQVASFEKMTSRIGQFRLGNFAEMESLLYLSVDRLRLVEAIKGLRLQNREELKTLVNVLDLNSWCEEALALLCQECGMDQDQMEEDFLNDELRNLYPMMLGLNSLSWDDLYNLFDDPWQMEESDQLLFFFRYLDEAPRRDVWEQGVERFGWQVGEWAPLQWNDIPLDFRGFCRDMKRNGLNDFLAAAEIAIGYGDIAQFTWSFYSEDLSDNIDFNLHNLRVLRKDFKRAQKVLERYQRENERLEREPEVLGKILALWNGNFKEVDCERIKLHAG